jgi:NTE family protein
MSAMCSAAACSVPGPVAFVLGGGGRLGAAEVGMLAALDGAGIVPDLVVGTSIGAINGALVAAHPGPAGVDRLRALWHDVAARGLLADGLVQRLRTLRRTRTSLHSSHRLEHLLDETFGAGRHIQDLTVPFACVAACIETAGPAWFERGPLVPALLASAAVPGLFAAVEIDGRHHFDGGLVDSIPLSRAVQAGARTVFVIQVGRIEQPLAPPTNPAQVAQVVFEIARRNRFTAVMADLPDHVTVHVLPSGGTAPGPGDVRDNLRYRDLTGVAGRIDAAEEASRRYLAQVGVGR